MKMLKQLFNFYINSSIHVALAVFALTWITLIELNLGYDKAVLYFVFYATITGYNFVKYFGVAKFYHRKLANWLKLIQILSFACFLLMCFYAYWLQYKTIFFVSCFAILTFFYAIPFFKNSTATLRHIGGVKVYVIAFVWTGTTVFLPVIDNGIVVSQDVFIIAIQRFIMVLALMIPFEIRDLKFDNLSLKTIPQKIGIQATKNLGMLFMVLFCVLEFLKEGQCYKKLIVVLPIAALVSSFVYFSKIEQNNYYSSFWVESIPIVWLFLLVVFG